MTLNDFIEEQLHDTEFKIEWKNSENDYQKMLADIENADKSEVSRSSR